MLPALLGTSPRRARASWSSRPDRSRFGKDRGSTSRPSKGPRINAEHEHRARQRSGAAALRSGRRPWRTHQSRRDTTGEGTRARRRCSTAYGVVANSPQPSNARTSSWRLPTTGRSRTRESMEMRPSAHPISIASRERALASRTPSSRRRPAHRRARRFSPARPSIVLKKGATCTGFSHRSYAVYPDLLEAAGYVVGHSGKGWGPGRFEPGGRTRNPAGPVFKNFDEFMQQRAAGKPFCFWFGSTDPHRPYEPGSGAQQRFARRPGSCAAVPAGHAGSSQRLARLLLRSAAVRYRSRRASSKRWSVRES